MRPATHLALTLLLTCGIPGARASVQSPNRVATLLQDPAVKTALDAGRAGEVQTIQQQIRFCEVPAPPFKESARAEVVGRAFQDEGLQVRIDRVGNVIADRRGAPAGPRLVVAAHLDTVFPEGTDVKVARAGTLLTGPGIGDNCRGLAVVVAIARVLERSSIRTVLPVTFVANVGEEGLGDLRGVRELFEGSMKGQIERFVSIDNAGLMINNRAVGSRRYRVTFKGPGGHSFAAFGAPNPAHALGRAIAKISDLHVPFQPRTTFNVGRVGGGTSVNSIPFDARFQKAIDSAVLEENSRWGSAQAVTVAKQLVGNRPAGETPASSAIVQTAQAVARALGLPAPLAEGSTDANLPISLNIPAITIGGGGTSAASHAPNETFDTTDSWKGTQHAVLLTIALAQP
jgi:acetylornithine deacetylase/succinyl-diaminopimelate desuccinylase-like protein